MPRTETADEVVAGINGELFKKQRLLLFELSDEAHESGDLEKHNLLEGLIGLTDCIADAAHDYHDVDCLLCDPDDDEDE